MPTIISNIIAFRTDKKLKKKLQDRAKKENRTISNLIKYILNKFL